MEEGSDGYALLQDMLILFLVHFIGQAIQQGSQSVDIRVCFQKHKSKKKLKKYAVSLLKPKGKQVVDVEYNL